MNPSYVHVEIALDLGCVAAGCKMVLPCMFLASTSRIVQVGFGGGDRYISWCAAHPSLKVSSGW